MWNLLPWAVARLTAKKGASEKDIQKKQEFLSAIAVVGIAALVLLLVIVAVAVTYIR